MRPRGVLRRDEIFEFITRLYDGDLHAKRVLSLANGTLGKHAVKQVDRLLSNEAVVMEEFFAHWVPYMVGSRPEVVVALDWTSCA